MHTCVYILYYIKERFSSKSAAQSFIPTPDTLLFEGEQVYVLMTVSNLACWLASYPFYWLKLYTPKECDLLVLTIIRPTASGTFIYTSFK